MDVNITNKTEEGILDRIRIEGDLTFEGATPSYDDLKKSLASLNKADEKLIVIRKVLTKFGATKADFVAYIYKNEKAMKETERITDKKPESKAKEAPKEEAKAKEEKPTEKKEEASKEEKTEDKKE